MEDSLEILSRYAKAGVREVWLTPHVMEDCPNTPEKLTKRFDDLKAAIAEAGIPCPELHLASEHMMDGLFQERIEQKYVLPHIPRHLLVETSYYNPPMDLDGILGRVKSNGFFPILAHPERYIYMDFKDYERLKDMGIRFQLNLSSLAGFYGPEAQKKAEKMLKLGYYSFTGTDLHRVSMLDRYFEAKVDSTVFERLKEVLNSSR